MEPSRKWLMSEALERAGQFGVAEWLDEVGDMQTKKPDEERILVIGSIGSPSSTGSRTER